MARMIRLDSELVRRGLVRSRTEAQAVITAGNVTVDGLVADKPSRQINPAQAIEISEDSGPHWASRGAYKLLGALAILGDLAPEIDGVRALDAGASTGGFTDVLLSQGASSVVAVDVGYGQLIWRLQNDPRVEVHDRTNIRYLDPDSVAPAPMLVVSDLSFISLTLVIPALVAAAHPDATFLLMVKPQFEVGKERLGAGGVVRDTALHAESIANVIESAQAHGLDAYAVAASPLPGPAGNVEYFVALQRRAPHPLVGADLAAAIEFAIDNGPAGKGTR